MPKADYEALLSAVSRLSELESLVKAQALRIQELEERLNKNSTNSSIPPSMDKISQSHNKSGKGRGKRKPGGQKGHKGHTRHLVDSPDRIVDCRPSTCQICQASLLDIQIDSVERRQVIDIPPIQPEVIEYQGARIRCTCGHLNTAEFPDKVNTTVQMGENIGSFLVYLNVAQLVPYKRLQNLCSDLFNLPLSTRTIENILIRAHHKAEPIHSQIRDIVKSGDWVGSDETGIRVGGERWWGWVWQNNQASYHVVDNRRGYAVVEKYFGEDFTEILLHDCWSAHNNTVAGAHQLCHTHLVRDLQGLIENFDSSWAKKFQKFLLTSSKARDQIWKENFDEQERQKVIADYHLQLEGFIAIAQKEKKVRTFQKRIEKHRDKILLVMLFPHVPNHNNSSERAIRMAKVKQKISGCFRSQTGAERYAVLLSVLETAKKQNRNLLEAIKLLLKGDLVFSQGGIVTIN